MSDPVEKTLLVVGKPNDERLQNAMSWLAGTWRGAVMFRELMRPEWPADLSEWEGDYLVSYRCPAIVPAGVLQRARRAAINFHPSPPEYRGIGTVNFALYDGATTYGVTCHHMTPRVDSGPIIAVHRFPIAPTDTVASILTTAYTAMDAMFRDLMTTLCHDGELPRSVESWKGRLRTRAELNALCVVTPDMDPEEIRRRVRSVDYPGFPSAEVTLGGIVFRAEANNGREPSR